MTPEETVKRKIKLNNQAVKLIRGEMRELLHLKNLLHLEKFLQSKVSQEFDQSLSARLDAIRFLIESFETGARSPDPCGKPIPFRRAFPWIGREHDRLDQTLSKTP